jgi:hypothetical protein
MENSNSKLNTILLIIVIILLAVGVYFLVNKKSQPQDGDFLQNSEQENTVPVVINQQSAPSANTITFAPLTTTYIGGQSSGGQWPPLVTTVPANSPCTATNPEFEKVAQRTINGKVYCVQTRTESASGSTYTTYTYTTGTTRVTFTLRFSNCGNYDDLQNNQCLAERANFNPDKIIIDANL